MKCYIKHEPNEPNDLHMSEDGNKLPLKNVKQILGCFKVDKSHLWVLTSIIQLNFPKQDKMV